MRDLTEKDVAEDARRAFGTFNNWRGATVSEIAFANAILARYGIQPSEREMRERERAAWDACADFGASTLSRGRDWILHQRERDRRYPLPSPEPTPQPIEERVAYLEQRLAQLLDAHGENF